MVAVISTSGCSACATESVRAVHVVAIVFLFLFLVVFSLVLLFVVEFMVSYSCMGLDRDQTALFTTAAALSFA